MDKLYEKIKQFSLKDAYDIEEKDRQFLALKKLEKNFNNKNTYLWLIIANAIICYQLSWTWEEYWEEFEYYFSSKNFLLWDIIKELSWFVQKSRNNKRFVNIKIKRLEKLDKFLLDFDYNKYINNLVLLRDELSDVLNQKKDAKTIVFSVKMFYYWLRILNYDVKVPYEISIPIDSRLTKIYEKYSDKNNAVEEFYSNLANELWIPELNLDSILWVNYNYLMKD